jgi:rhamnulokinase
MSETDGVRLHAAIDLGAESGRVIAGTVGAGDGGGLQLEEVHRFPNRSTRKADGTMHWQLEELFEHCVTGLKILAESGRQPVSIGVDSWGVDYVLLDEAGKWILPVHHYRDRRTARGVEAALARASREDIYAETGIQFMPLNTLFQLMAEDGDKLSRAHSVVGVGDAINHRLGGRPVYEVSMASTTMLYNPAARQWSDPLIRKMGLRRELFPEIVASGTVIGELDGKLCGEFGWMEKPPAIIASCTHDTGSAVAAVPATGRDWAYLSSGTWSLMGVETESPILTDQCRELNFTNEVGYGHSIRLLKNLSGMWLVQECRREWTARGMSLTYQEMTRLAEDSEPFRSLIDPSRQEFLAPESMTAAMAEFCRKTDQPVPESPGQFIRCAFESLAMLYARTLDELEKLTGVKRTRLHIVGGGSQNAFLNQLAADATGLQVLAGPVEATALGNILIQSMAITGESPDQARERVRQTFPMQTFTPRPGRVPESVHRRFQAFRCE